MRKKIKTLTDTQIKALPTTPITIVAAPGSGFRIKLIAASIRKIQNSGAYTGVNTTYAALVLQTGLGTWLSSAIANDNIPATDITNLSNFLGGANDRYVDLLVPYAEGYTASGDGVLEYSGMPLHDSTNANTSYDNQSLDIGMDNNGSGNLGGGHATNKWRVTVYYEIESLG